MTRPIRLVCALAACAALGGCLSGPTGPTPAEITGTWQATSYVYLNKNGLDDYDMIAAGGSATLVLRADKSAELRRTRPGQAPEVIPGTWMLDAERFGFILGPGNDWNFEVKLTGNTLRLTDCIMSYDFHDDGTMEQAEWQMTLTR